MEVKGVHQIEKPSIASCYCFMGVSYPLDVEP